MIEITISGDQRVVTATRTASSRLRDEEPAMKLISMIGIGSAHTRFQQEGPGWAPLAESTKSRRRGKVYKLLQDQGLLVGSLTPGKSNQYSINETTAHTATWGTTRPGAWAHQVGVTAGFFVRLPRRRFLYHSEQDIADYERTLADFHAEGWEI